MANIIRNENSVNIVAENADGDVVGSVGGMRDENNNWELIALYVDENVIGDTKFALSLVQEFAKRVKDAGATTFTTGTSLRTHHLVRFFVFFAPCAKNTKNCDAKCDAVWYNLWETKDRI